MAIKLKLRLLIPQSALLLKALLFGGLLTFAKVEGLGWAPVLLFGVGAVALYTNPALRPVQFAGSFAVLLMLAWGMMATFTSPLLWGGAMLAASFFFAVLIGVKDVLFVYRKEWHYLLHLGLVYGTLVLFFLRGPLLPPPVLLAGLFAIFFFLIREYLTVTSREEIPTSALRASVAGGLALGMVEVCWALRMLPLGFLNAANAGFLVFFIGTTITTRFFEKKLTSRVVLSFATLFIALLLLVFVTSDWGLR